MKYFLGRIVEHDPRSLTFAAARATTLKSVTHARRIGPLNQGEIGSCTGEAMAGALMTDPVWRPTIGTLTQADALELYEMATKLDNAPGSYPPDDTGSSGLAVAKAAKQAGYISAYHHAFGLQHTLEALVLQPVIIGINWYESFFEPVNGMIELAPGTEIAGGHEVELVALDVAAKTVTFCNSWGASWGNKGYAKLTWALLEQLLSEDGDCTVPVALKTQAA